MKYLLKLGFALLLAGLIVACDRSDNDEQEERVMTGDLDATRMVTMGNSLTAGFMDGGWTYESLRHSYATQIARQIYGDGRVGDDPAEHQFLISRIKDPGNPVPASIAGTQIVGHYEDGTPVVMFDITPPENRFTEDALTPANVGAEPNFNNLAVPGFTALDVLETSSTVNRLGRANPFFSLSLRDRGSQFDQALQIDPTFVIMWAGSNEALGSALSGGTMPPYPPQDTEGFNAPGYQSNLEELLSPFVDTDVNVVIATVPDVTSIPFVTEIGVPKSDGTLGFIVGEHGEEWSDTLTFWGTEPDGSVRPVVASEYVLLDWLLQGDLSLGLNPDNPLSDSLWLSNEQEAMITSTIAAYNDIILNAADQNEKVAAVDINSFFNQIVAQGGIDNFEAGLFGGLFSLDGVHPSRVGHAYAANEFIRVINSRFGAQIPELNPADYAEEVPGAPEKWGLAPGQQNPAYEVSKQFILRSN